MGLVSVGRIRLAETTYAFVDGEYLMRVYIAAMQEFFASPGELDLGSMKSDIGAKRVFYYDCLDDLQLENETREAFQSRVTQQEVLFEKMRAIEGFHVRLGTLSGTGKRPRQKEVDVLLAVDMMNHAVGGNMTQAVLVSGDRDFKPVVESLVQLGTYIRVYYERKSAAKELWHAADGSTELTIPRLHSWSSERFRTSNPIPHATQGSGLPSGEFQPIKRGVNRNRTVTLYRRGAELLMFAEQGEDGPSLAMSWSNQRQLETLFEEHVGRIRWD